MAPDRVVVHIGTHKTGTTSLQQFLRDEADGLLAGVDASVPPGFFLRTLHADLPLLTMREQRLWPARIRFPETRRTAWLRAAETHVRHQVLGATRPVLVYSHEDLSYLRFDDELGRLRDLFAGTTVDVVVFLRERTDFLRSYREQLVAAGFALSDDPSSFAYTEEDSWLVDYDALADGYRRCFGETSVTVLDYDQAVRDDGSVIPAFAELLGISRSSLPPLDRYVLNRSGAQLRPTEAQVASIRERLARQAQ